MTSLRYSHPLSNVEAVFQFRDDDHLAYILASLVMTGVLLVDDVDYILECLEDGIHTLTINGKTILEVVPLF